MEVKHLNLSSNGLQGLLLLDTYLLSIRNNCYVLLKINRPFVFL